MASVSRWGLNLVGRMTILPGKPLGCSDRLLASHGVHVFAFCGASPTHMRIIHRIAVLFCCSLWSTSWWFGPFELKYWGCWCRVVDLAQARGINGALWHRSRLQMINEFNVLLEAYVFRIGVEWWWLDFDTAVCRDFQWIMAVSKFLKACFDDPLLVVFFTWVGSTFRR